MLFISKSKEYDEVRIVTNSKHSEFGLREVICKADELSVCNLDEIVKNNIIQFE